MGLGSRVKECMGWTYKRIYSIETRWLQIITENRGTNSRKFRAVNTFPQGDRFLDESCYGRTLGWRFPKKKKKFPELPDEVSYSAKPFKPDTPGGEVRLGTRMILWPGPQLIRNFPNKSALPEDNENPPRFSRENIHKSFPDPDY